MRPGAEGLRTEGLSRHARSRQYAAAAEAAAKGHYRHGAHLRRAHERHGLRHRGAARAPEAAAGGPLALVRNGDKIELDVPQRRLHLEMSDEELARRRTEWEAPTPPDRGYYKLYVDHVQQAHLGADLDFLVGNSGAAVPRDSH